MRSIVGGSIVKIKVSLNIYYFDILKQPKFIFVNFKKNKSKISFLWLEIIGQENKRSWH